MAGLVFPDVGVFLSGADPNDPSTVDVWSSNVAPARTWRINQAGRGRQYELDQNLEGSASLDWRNADEFLNPANATSPLLAYAKPMRRIRMMASYPPAGTGNTINTTAGQDPTVDSYTTGTLPSWLVAVGGTTPTVQAANPHSGTKSVQYTVAATATPQGVSTIPLPTFPGRQYTASWFVRQSTASTQQIAVGGLTALDRFQRSGALNGSTAETGQTWSFNGGATGDYTTTAGPNPPGNGTAGLNMSSAAVDRFALLSVSAQDFDFRTLVTIPAVAAGDLYNITLIGRWVDANNHYRFGLQLNTTGLADIRVWKKVGGVFTALTSVASAFAYTAGQQMWVRAQGSGQTLTCTVWPAGTTMPASPTLTATDASVTAAGQVGFHTFRSTANTNAATVAFGPLAVASYSTPGTTTATTGAYTRLQVTFTATQPAHFLAITTVGTAVAGTVNLDDVQLEPGGTASTFTTTGPLIRGLWGGHLNELPVTWTEGTQGFEGTMQATCVGPFAALAQIPIHTDYVTAVLRKVPAYYWPLWDQSGTSTFAEVSGNGGPALTRLDSFFGGPTSFTSATPTNIPGDPSGAGLFIDADTASSHGSMIQAGWNGVPAIRIGNPVPNWSVTASLWIAEAQNAAAANTGGDVLDLFNGQNVSTTITTPIQVTVFPATNQLELNSSYLGFTVAQTMSDTANVPPMGTGPHHLVVTTTLGGGNITHQLWWDGVQYVNRTQTLVFEFGTSTPNMSAQAISVGGIQTLDSNASFHWGTVSHVAVWNRALSAAEIADLWNAGGLANIGETSATRVSRYLGNYFIGPSVVDSSALSRMGAPTAPESTPLLQALQRVQDTEMGNLFENRDGAVQFDGRELRWQRLTPTVVFGDGPGEIPYTEAPVFGFGLTQTNNQSLITRTGGIRAVGRADTTGSITSFYARGFTLQVDCLNDAEAQQHADWIVLTRAQPKQRVTKVRINLGANPSAFPALLNLEIGTRATVNRRPKAANAGTGITMTQDYFIENISHASVDPEAGTWFVDLEMSPVPTPQPWICGNATYSVCGQTTIPGF